mgnify:CR=1 FL=1
MTNERTTMNTRRYAYVRAFAPSNDLTLISFDHIFVQAADEEKAYRIGIAKTISLPPTQYCLNDYVFEV